MKPIILNSLDVESLIRACDVANEKGNDIIIRLVDSRSTRDLYQMMGCYDYLSRVKDSIQSNIYFEAIGILSQAEILVMLAIDIENRRFSEHSMMLWANPLIQLYGTAEEAVINIEARLELVNKYINIFVENTDMSVEYVRELMDKGEHFDRTDMITNGFLKQGE